MQVKLSDYFLRPFHNIANPNNNDRYNFILGGRGSLKSSTAADIAALNLCLFTGTSIMYIIRQKNKHYSTTYKTLRNSFRKLGAYNDWVFTGTEKTTPYVYKDDPNSSRRQEVLFRGVSTPEDVDKILSLEGDRLYDDNHFEKMDTKSTRWIVIIDEIQTMEEKVRQTIFTKLDDSLRGSIGNKEHQFFFLGNPPKAKNHFFNRVFNNTFGSNKTKLAAIMERDGWQERRISNFLGHAGRFLRTCYKNVPPEYLGKAFIAKMEYYRKHVYDKYLVEGLGVYVEGTSEVFDQFTPANIFSFDNWVLQTGGADKAKLFVTNLMKSGTYMFFENADTTFLETLKDTAITLGMPWLYVDGPRNERGQPNRKMGVIYRTTGMNDAYENYTLMVSDRCPMLIQETQNAVYDMELKEKKGVLQRVDHDNHGLDGVEYLASGFWQHWKNSHLKFEPQKFQLPYKIVLGGDFGDGGSTMEGEGATTCYIGYYSQAFRRLFILDEFYHKNANLPRAQRISGKQIAINLLQKANDFANGRW